MTRAICHQAVKSQALAGQDLLFASLRSIVNIHRNSRRSLLAGPSVVIRPALPQYEQRSTAAFLVAVGVSFNRIICKSFSRRLVVCPWDEAAKIFALCVAALVRSSRRTDHLFLLAPEYQ